MDDVTLVRACADAMGIRLWVDGGNQIMDHLVSTGIRYDPLHDDAQCFALVKRFSIHVFRDTGADEWEVSIGTSQPTAEAHDADLNRAICECVARAQPGET